MLKTDYELVKYLENHQVYLAENGLTFMMARGLGHYEFYAYGPKLIAVSIYDAPTLERLELLVVGKGMTTKEVDMAVKEMVNMIKRKRLGPVERRIKE